MGRELLEGKGESAGWRCIGFASGEALRAEALGLFI